jgi:hypothetical protein
MPWQKKLDFLGMYYLSYHCKLGILIYMPTKTFTSSTCPECQTHFSHSVFFPGFGLTAFFLSDTMSDVLVGPSA